VTKFGRTAVAMAMAWGLASTPAAVCAQERSDTYDEASAAPSHSHGQPRIPVNWTGVITGSVRLLALQHGARVAFQDWTRDELGGPFFSDWRRSVKLPGTWGDGDPWTVNYLGHSVQGAASGFIWVDNDGGVPDPALGSRKRTGRAAVVRRHGSPYTVCSSSSAR
jgi:hypothetical protein